MRDAFRKASLDKLAKGIAKRQKREERKKERLAKVRERIPEEAAAERPPEPIVPEQTGAALQVQAQHFLQDKTARENKIRALAKLARGGETPDRPPVVEEEPKPITPDDPRIQNGTLAPTPKVARHLEPEAVEARERETAAWYEEGFGTTEPERGRPLQTSPYPDGYLEWLATASPESIISGRELSQLTEDETEAYNHAIRRRLETGTPEEILAGRDPSQLNDAETEGYNRAVARRLETGTPEEILAGRTRRELRGAELRAYKDACKRLQIDRRLSNPWVKKARRPSARFGRTPFGLLIDEYRLPLNLKVYELAELAGLKTFQVNRIIAQVPGTPEQIEAIRSALDIPEERLVLNGITAPKSETKPAPKATETVAKKATAKPAAKPAKKKVPPLNSGPEHAVRVSKSMRAFYDRRPADPRWSTPLEGDAPYQIALKRLIGEQNLSAHRLSEIANVNQSIVTRTLTRPGRKCSLKNLERIAAALGTTVAEIAPDRLKAPKPAPDAPKPAPIHEMIAAGVSSAMAAAERAAPVSAPSLPRPPIEYGIPVPPLAIRSDWYRWEEMKKGGSFLAECPAGIAWETFRDRFLKLADRQAEKLGHWYVNEADDKTQTVRIWRIM